ncbi:LysR family transcriptional regulator [Ramlibacter ginsenosidimutans]|uniref:LysR family transcriptional regulator n=1 Tax=Ramlibacter ginsenosidimutans TaxID=502333 RepID=A0A934WLJ2_9BURK|nr:LysR family transcriptional regulator [Ramlibacter ginsenosidimutans]MBK6005631.1 LysR family transcriptional regulator [Ramlibacter ginsenosidimutans]
MELYQLRTFLAVAEEANLTRAAERVHTSAPAVSAQVKALEEELGVRLFDRTSRGMTLTSAGERVAAEARRTLAAAQGLRTTAAELRGASVGTVRMGAVSDPVGLRLGEVFVKLAERHPGLSMHLQQALSNAAIEQVRRGALDCAYVMSSLASDDELEVLRLAPIDVVPLLPPRWAQTGLPADNAELARRPWVGTAPHCGLRASLDTFFGEAGIEPAIAAVADTEAAIRGMVASGLGAGLVREDQARDAQRLGEAVIWPQWKAATWLCWIAAPAARQGPPVRTVREIVMEVWQQGA